MSENEKDWVEKLEHDLRDYVGDVEVKTIMSIIRKHAPDVAELEGKLQIAMASCKRRGERISRLKGVLREIASKFTQKHRDKLEEWKDCGTEAFEDLEYLDALAKRTIAEIAERALSDSPAQNALEGEGCQ